MVSGLCQKFSTKPWIISLKCESNSGKPVYLALFVYLRPIWSPNLVQIFFTEKAHMQFNPFTTPACKMHGCACKQCIFCSYIIYFQCHAFWWKSFRMPVRKRRQKELKVSDFALWLVVFKWHHGSEGVNLSKTMWPWNSAQSTKAVWMGRAQQKLKLHNWNTSPQQY